MFLKIKNRVDKELKSYISSINKEYSLKNISPLLFESIREFISREGKRVRPVLFLIGYLGFSRKNPSRLYRSALSLELLHDFMLVHDDIIDKSDTRRGKPSMHAAFNKLLKGYRGLKFNGEDLTIVAGDVMFSMAIHAFLEVNEDLRQKEEALKKLIKAAFFTGGGEFIELLCGLKRIEKITKEDIYKIYDYKTANYTFASPLTIGATLAGAKKEQLDKLFKYGTYLGRAFQIKDDILGLFGSEKKIGKSNLTDLQEAKKTILIWKAYNLGGMREKSAIRNILNKNKIGRNDLFKMRKIVVKTGSLDYARKEVCALKSRALNLFHGIKLRDKYKTALNAFAEKTLSL